MSPNCVGNLPGTRYYPSWAGKRGPKYPLELRLVDDQFRIMNRHDGSTVATFADLAEVDSWCDSNGISSDEIGPYNGPWD